MVGVQMPEHGAFGLLDARGRRLGAPSHPGRRAQATSPRCARSPPPAGPPGTPPPRGTARPRAPSPRHRKDSDSLRKACILVATRQRHLARAGTSLLGGARRAAGWAGLWLRPRVGFPESRSHWGTGLSGTGSHAVPRSLQPCSRALGAAVLGLWVQPWVRARAPSGASDTRASRERDGGGSDWAVLFTPSWGGGAGADAAPPPAAQAGGPWPLPRAPQAPEMS